MILLLFIYLLILLIYSSHSNVMYSTPLKRAYGRQIEEIMQAYVTYISKAVSQSVVTIPEIFSIPAPQLSRDDASDEAME